MTCLGKRNVRVLRCSQYFLAWWLVLLLIIKAVHFEARRHTMNNKYWSEVKDRFTKF